MRSYTSNSDIHLARREYPEGAWVRTLIIGLFLAALAVAALEARLAAQGIEPTVVDSPALWARERGRASELGARALILIGGSRMQLDVDVDTLRELTGREPVQLAIDGSSFVSVLSDLADDPRVTGTVLVDYQDAIINELHRQDGAATYLAAWTDARQRGLVPDFAASEAALEAVRNRYFRSYADGATPVDSLLHRALIAHATQQYLITLPSRERRADYRKVEMPGFYYSRAVRNAGVPVPEGQKSWAAFDRVLRDEIGRLRADELPNFDANARAIANMVSRIEARGGHVVFTVFPTSGLVRAADERRFPRSRYWERFIRTVDAPAVHFADVPALSGFICPDGSHLDARDQAAFTRALVATLYTSRQKNPVAATL